MERSGAPTAAAIRVRSRAGDYPVVVRRGLARDLPALLAEHAPARRYALVADSTVAELHGGLVLDRLRSAGLRVDPTPFPAGEAQKSRETWAALTDRLLALGLGRDSAVIALGGGVTGDLAGFVAATYMRGIPVVQVPTSLVAMIDASVGGKTAVDVPAGKNLVGAFHAPRLVAVDPDLAVTLPVAERAQGLVEAVKHGAILDVEYLDFLERAMPRLLEGDPEATQRAVVRSVELKAEVVSRDEREGGLRRILNFGHTVGHALEAAAEYGLGHGTAVALGMILEARLGERLGVTERGSAPRLERIVASLGLPTEPPPDASPDVLLEFIRRDKKAREGEPRWVLLDRPGRVAPGAGWTHAVPEQVVREVLGGRRSPG